MVIADTSAWIPFFNRPGSPQKREIDALIDADRLVLVGVVLAELIQGCRTPREAETLASQLMGLPFLDTRVATWRRAGELSFGLRRRGVTQSGGLSQLARRSYSNVRCVHGSWGGGTSDAVIQSVTREVRVSETRSNFTGAIDINGEAP